MFFSRQLNKTEINYSTIDRELLGVHSAILHFQYFLEGREFNVFTDHNPIVSAMKKKTELKPGRQTRQLASISEFTMDIQHIDVKDNVVADTLPGIPPQKVTLVVDPSDVEQQGNMPGFMFDAVNTIRPGLDYQAMLLA